jgi:SAM-dependent methyltransferase
VPAGSRVLIAGAGTGQMFDFLPAALFAGCQLICSDVSQRLLKRLHERVKSETVVDDIEDSRLDPGFGLVIVVLVLEHVDSRKALASIARLAPERLIIVIQENPSQMNSALTPGRVVPESLRGSPQDEQPRLINYLELCAEVGKYGFSVQSRLEIPVADGKKMVGVMFRKDYQ